jgi:hypothetical protein
MKKHSIEWKHWFNDFKIEKIKEKNVEDTCMEWLNQWILRQFANQSKNNQSGDMRINYINFIESRNISWRKWTEQKDYEKKDYAYC